MEPRIWLIAGPTASGKSALALKLAQATGAEIVNADSMQLYAGLQVITAGPSPHELKQAAHHLFGAVDPADGWSVGHWQRAASRVLDEIRSRGRSAVIVGGTGLYFRALTQGLAEVPPLPPEARESADAEFAEMGEAAFRTRLAEADPAAAERIAPGDRQRLVRAWEVYAGTGKPLSAWQETGDPTITEWSAVALEPPRDALYDRCDARLAAMLHHGALDEVRDLVARRLHPDLPAMKAVGVREFAAYLAGQTTRDEALLAAQMETRRYAKRQMTWMRGQMADWPRLTALEPDEQWRQFIAQEPALTP
jgi:tRNA dimethylallyltransferase